MVAFFFFQAEDGIRDLTVTGVQTCALPILSPAARSAASIGMTQRRVVSAESASALGGSRSDTASSGNVTSGAYSRRTRGSATRSEEHTSELQSQSNLVCRLLLEKKKQVHGVRRWIQPYRPYPRCSSTACRTRSSQPCPAPPWSQWGLASDTRTTISAYRTHNTSD